MNVWFVTPSDPYIVHPIHAVYSPLGGCHCSFSIYLVENRQHISGGGKLRPPNSLLTHSGLSSDSHARSVIGVDTGVKYSGGFFIDTFGSIAGGELSGWVLFTARLSIVRSTISGFSVGNCGELTHGHGRAVIGVDTGVKYCGEFFRVTFGSIVGGAFSGRVIFISRASFILLTISCFTVGNRGESTHGHAGAVIGVDTGVTLSGRCVFTSSLASVSIIFTIVTFFNDGLLFKTSQST